jgi:hypothetical protein
MNEIFKIRIDKLPEQLRMLEECKVIDRRNLSNVPKRGVYVFLENDKPVYVGRTNRMRQRLLEHGRSGAGHNDASFAFKLAKEKAQKLGIAKRTRAEFIADEQFKSVFSVERDRVASMSIKYIEIVDPVDQYLFELYASEILQTPYNDFENH